MECDWKENWPEARRHFVEWWRREGLLVGSGSFATRNEPRVEAPDPGAARDLEQLYTDVEWRTARDHRRMACGLFPLDALPCTDWGLGPGTLACYLGSEPQFTPETVWYHPTMADAGDPEGAPPLRFDLENRWWKLTERMLTRQAELAGGRYMVGCPDLIENVDILASLRTTEQMLIDFVIRPGWVEQKVAEINRAWIEAYERIYEIIALEDGSSAFWAFGVWAPGKAAKLQCDANAMFSPAMFERFVVPALTEQCEFLDRSLFHLDGHQCIPHLELLLGIEALDAVEWTPDPQVPSGGDPCWYDMYRRIREAGKCVQAIGVRHEEIVPLIDAVGPEGLYIMTDLGDERKAEKVARLIEPYR